MAFLTQAEIDAADVTAPDPVARDGVNLKANYETRHLFSYLTFAQQRAALTNDYTGIDLTAFRANLQRAFSDAIGRRLIIPPSCYIKLNGPIRVPSRAYIHCPLGTHSAFLPYTDPNDAGAILGSAVFYPDLSINWKTAWPLRGLLETDNYTWAAGPQNPPKPDYWSWAAIEGLSLRAHQDPLYATYPERVPDYGLIQWCPSDETKVMRCVARYFGRSGFFNGGLQATGTFQECSSWHNGENQDTVFGDTVTRSASPFSEAVTVFSPVHINSSFVNNQIVVEAANAAVLNGIAVGDVLTVNGGNVTVSAYATATRQIVQRTRTNGTVTTARFIRTLTLTAPLTARLLGRVFHWGFASGNHPDRNFAPGVAAEDGGQSSGGQFRGWGLGGDYNRDALVGFDGAHYATLLDLKSENHPAAVDITGNAVGGGRARISLLGKRVEHGTAATTAEDYGMIRITGTCRPTVRWDGVAVLNHANILVDHTPLAVGNGNAAGSDGKQYAFLPRGRNAITAAENGGVFGIWGLDGSDFSQMGPLTTGQMFVGGSPGLFTVANTTDGSTNTQYAMGFRVDFTSGATYKMQIRMGGTPLDLMVINNLNAGGTNGTTWNTWSTANNGMLPSFRFAETRFEVNIQAAPMAFNGATPIAKPTLAAAATDAASAQTLVNSIRTALQNLGLAA